MTVYDSALFKVDLENYNGPLDTLLDLAKAQKVLSNHKLRTFEIGSIIKGNLKEQIQYS